MKIVINDDWGGFGLSEEAYKELGLEWDGFGYAFNGYECRTNPKLVEVVERLGSERASGHFAKLKVIEIPDGIDWVIYNYDGIETVYEKHRSWS